MPARGSPSLPCSAASREAPAPDGPALRRSDRDFRGMPVVLARLHHERRGLAGGVVVGPSSGLQVITGSGSAQVPPPHRAGTDERLVSPNTATPLVATNSGRSGRSRAWAVPLPRSCVGLATGVPAAASATVSSAAAARRYIPGPLALRRERLAVVRAATLDLFMLLLE